MRIARPVYTTAALSARTPTMPAATATKTPKRSDFSAMIAPREKVASNSSGSFHDAIVPVFVHGWKHDARTDDHNLSSFREVLAETAAYEAGSKQSTKFRPV